MVRLGKRATRPPWLEVIKAVIDMTHPASALQHNSAFDSFLFAPVGDDGKGMTVSVLSALARLGFDPREEAAELAQLPRDEAQRRLAAVVADVAGVPSAKAEPASIAARLVALLPLPRGNLSPSPAPAGAGAANRPLTKRYLLLWGALMALSLVSQSFFAAGQTRSPQPGAAAPISAAVSSQPQLPSAGTR